MVAMRRKGRVISASDAEIDARPLQTPERRPPKLLHTVNAANVIPEKVEFLWFPYIPRGKLTLLEGDPGMGKSWLSCAIAKAVAGGENLPGQEGRAAPKPQRVLLMSAEDGIRDTIVPRLTAMNANLTLIDMVDGPVTLDYEGVRSLEHTMLSFSATIVFIDPIVAYVGSKMDMHRANEVREVMAGLSRAAERAGCSVVVVRHLRKAESKNRLYRGIGSIDFTAAARSLLVTDYAKDGHTRLLRHIKCNVAREGRPLAYEILTPSQEEGEAGGQGTFSWLPYEPGDDDDTEIKASTTPKGMEEAVIFLMDFLNNGPKPALEVLEAARAAGISERTLKRAKSKVAVSDNEHGTWVWRLLLCGVHGDE